MKGIRGWQAKLARMTGKRSQWDRKAYCIKKRLDEVRDVLNQQRRDTRGGNLRGKDL